jgi:GAF domain-containing protein
VGGTSKDRVDRALLDAVIGIGTDLDLSSTLDRIVTAACELVEARYGALGVVGPDGKRLVRFILHGVTDDEIAAIGPFPEGHGLLGLLVEHPVPLRLHDLTEHPQSYGFPPNHPPMQSFLGVPIRTREHVYGNLYLTEKADGADFTEEDEHTVTALAAAAGVVIDNARLYADTERRRRWHEVTAEITQLMLGDFDPDDALRLIARRAREVSGARVGAVLLSSDDDLVVEAVDGPDDFQQHVGRHVPGDLPVLGDVVHGGRQVVIDDFAQAVKENGRLVDVQEVESLGFRPRLTCEGPLDTSVPVTVRPQILAAIRESLSNVVRHARASEVTVHVIVANGKVVARVADNGVGLDAGSRQSGLRNLRERAETLGGTVLLQSNQPQGTILELRAPLG